MAHTERLTAADLIRLVLDEGSWSSWDAPPVRAGISAEYAEALRAATEKSGVDEAVLSGEGMMHGRRVAVVVGEFGFLAGSIGVDAANRLVAAIERATAEGLPLLAAPISGGTRMQEGTPAFVQMVRISQAVMAHKGAGLPYLVYLRNPTTGGVMASWGSLGHVTVRRARGPGRVPGAAGVRSALRQAVPSRRADGGEPLRPRHHRRRRRTRRIAGILDRALTILRAPRTACRQSPPRPRTRSPMSTPGRR